MSVLNPVDEVTSLSRPSNFVDGGWEESRGDSHEVLDPATGKVIGRAPRSGKIEVERAVGVAEAAQLSWEATPAPVRGELLRTAMGQLRAHRDQFASLMTQEMGKPLRESYAEIDRALGELDYMAGEGTRLEGSTVPSRRSGHLVMTQRTPLGVIGAITPWNFPLIAPVRKLGPALVCGNAVVLKPAQETPLIALALAVLLRDAGLPDGVLNVVCGSGTEAGAEVAADVRVAGVSFTGSTEVGRTLAATVSGRLGAVQLELGGKNPAYVHRSADVPSAAGEIAGAALQTAGQRCTAISRVLVDHEVADDLVRHLSEAFDRAVVGSGLDAQTDVGPLVTAEHRDRVADYVRIGHEEGATVVTAAPTALPEGPYHAPTVLDHVTPQMRVAREEIFGPVLSVLRVSGADEAIRAANDCDYGLTSAVFSADLGTALRFMSEVRAGMVHVNHGTNSEPHVPFGGVDDSGLGAYSIGQTAKDFFTELKVAYVRAP